MLDADCFDFVQATTAAEIMSAEAVSYPEDTVSLPSYPSLTLAISLSRVVLIIQSYLDDKSSDGKMNNSNSKRSFFIRGCGRQEQEARRESKGC